ncbi:16S rRNA (cytidine(1402)-2'-O)-methyltransferase [bacterium CG_4_10_14_0_8_um_filter_33_57]|nr:MAG: 16S rRNA (cytidine(1402)-2'-O)-methyltransferase [bacterium CG_4_10_14_0_8_um_filter_33_57]
MGNVYIVATPIGNLEDITLRAIRILKEVDLIACEDTRKTRILTDYYKIKTPLTSYHQHTKREKIEALIREIENGKNVAIVTDAGTPGVADPGGVFIEEAVKNNINIIPIPGLSSLTAAISISGFKTDESAFYGFLPTKKGRQTKLKQMSQENRAIILFESPFRIKKLLREILEFLGDREVVVTRELTKKFEDIYRGKVSEIIDAIKEKGEFTVIIKSNY